MPRIGKVSDTYAVQGLTGHWHRTLELPCGYQHFSWMPKSEPNLHGVIMDNSEALVSSLREDQGTELYLYTQHEIFLQDGLIKHTRSSPNWEGGLVTYATCKHLMRSYNRSWEGVWLAGLCPKGCADNTLLFAGKVSSVFPSNYALSRYVLEHWPDVYKVKEALGNPRGDLYTPTRPLHKMEAYDHKNYKAPQQHTRSVDLYKKSPGSVSDRPDGKIPKWWRDLEYQGSTNRRPPSFILSPCHLFSRPSVWTSRSPKRAVLRLTAGNLADSLRRG